MYTWNLFCLAFGSGKVITGEADRFVGISYMRGSTGKERSACSLLLILILISFPLSSSSSSSSQSLCEREEEVRALLSFVFFVSERRVIFSSGNCFSPSLLFYSLSLSQSPLVAK
jgi:uncharacterized membrane protein